VLVLLLRQDLLECMLLSDGILLLLLLLLLLLQSTM